MKTRMIAMLMTLALLLSLMPAAVLAEDGAEEEAATYEGTQDSVDPDETAEEEAPEAPAAEAYEADMFSDVDTSAENIAGEDEEIAELQESTEAEIYADGYSDTYSVTLLTGTSVAIPISYDLGDSGVSNIYLHFDTDNTTAYQVSWGEWINYYDCNLNITGLTVGKGTITVSLKDASDDSILDSMQIYVTVKGSLSGSCGTNVTWKLDNKGTLTIQGSGAMEELDSAKMVPWYDSRKSIKSVNISGRVTSIGDFSLYKCSNVTSITIPNSVTSIGYSAFCGCSSLTSITIPNSVMSIDNYAFCDCSSLTSITIPNSVTSIGEGTFWDCSSLTSITIPNSVTSIGYSAFSDCSSLTSISIPNRVTNIGEYAFAFCSSLTSITIPNSVTSIGGGTFWDCSSLTSISIPNGVTSIGDRAFAYCSSLTSTSIPNSVTSIGEYAFFDCSSLTSITIPAGVEDITGNVFMECDSLNSIGVSQANPYYSSKDGVLFNKDQTQLLICPAGKTGRYDIPKTVKNIAALAFYQSNLTSVRFSNTGNQVTTIGANAFASCWLLHSITIPNTVTSIGEHALGYTASRWSDPDGFSNFELNSDFTAYVYSGSAAEQYCKTSGVNYIVRDQAVSNLTSSVSEDGQVTLSWTGVSGATGYKISRGISADGKDLYELDTTTSTSYTDKTITAVGTYYYVVEPYWMAGDERLVGIANSMQKANITSVPSGRSPFTDVQDTTEYYYQPVLWAVGKNITTGTTTTTFSPYETCTRAQIITFLWRAAGCPEPKNTTNSFTDVQQGAYYYKAVCWAAEQGIADTTAATFGVNEPCTRILAVTYMYRAAGSPSVNTASNPFTDVTSAADKRAVVWAVNAGVTNGTSATTFSPYETCTRGQIVTFLYRNR